MAYRVLGICGGNGTVLYPFRKQLLGNIEMRPLFHTHNDIQWKLNFNVPQDHSIDVHYSSKLVDVIIGAPDCGHSSALAYSRAKKLADPKLNNSLNAFIWGINEYQPKFFLMENLPKLLESWGSDIKTIFSNYRLVIHNKSVSYWGNSQISRIRLVIIGIRKDLPYNLDAQFKLPDPPYNLKTSWELVGDLREENPETCNVRENPNTQIALYYKGLRKITAQFAQELWMGKFQDYRKWPVNEGNLKNQPGIYRNFKDSYPLTVRKQSRQFNHWGLMMSPREMARIQNVPDEFKLWYDGSQYSINKARITIAKSPPYDIGLWAKHCLDNL